MTGHMRAEVPIVYHDDNKVLVAVDGSISSMHIDTGVSMWSGGSPIEKKWTVPSSRGASELAQWSACIDGSTWSVRAVFGPSSMIAVTKISDTKEILLSLPTDIRGLSQIPTMTDTLITFVYYRYGDIVNIRNTKGQKLSSIHEVVMIHPRYMAVKLDGTTILSESMPAFSVHQNGRSMILPDGTYAFVSSHNITIWNPVTMDVTKHAFGNASSTQQRVSSAIFVPMTIQQRITMVETVSEASLLLVDLCTIISEYLI